MALVVYVLCTLTALVCAWLLLRGYRKSRTRLLLWSSLCFAGLTANNALVIVDLVLVPSADLFLLRNVAGLAAMGVLLFGLIWEAK